ncbi:MAG: hypothetical protein U1F71_16820 [Verrucomicrobiaceae bacterium]
MITIDVSLIRKTIIEAVDAAVSRITREKRKNATSLGVDLDFRFGRLRIAINDDDDESFRCPYFEHFKDREWGLATFDESTVLADRLDGLDSDDEDDPQIRVVDGDEEKMLQILEDVCRWLFPKCIEWITSWFKEQPASRWRPIWLRVDEETVGEGESVRIAQNRKIPRAKKVEKEPLRLIGFTPPKSGIKIFKLGMREREYVDLWSDNFDAAPRFVGQPLADDYDEPIPVKTNPPLVRFGDLACYECGLVYLNSGRHAAALIDYFNDPNFERIPLFDGEREWTAVHPLKPVSVLDQCRTEFDWSPVKKAFDGVRVCEFDADALRRMGRSIFKIQESPFLGPFFLEDERSPGFLGLCEKMGLRGVKFELIWCEDLSEILPKFEEFMDRIKAFVKRLTGGCSIKKMESTPRLSGIHKTFWRLGAFRELLKESGAEKALTTFPEIASVIRSLSSVVPSRYSASDDPFSKKVISEVEQRFNGKEILEEVRGRLCLHLPKALALLKDLETSRN